MIWMNYNDLTTTEPWESLVNKENNPQMALIQPSELQQFSQNGDWIMVG